MKTQEQKLESVIRDLLFTHYHSHPLPWRIEEDWTREVTAADGFIIAKCANIEEAQIIIDAMEKLDKDLKTPIDLTKYLESIDKIDIDISK